MCIPGSPIRIGKSLALQPWFGIDMLYAKDILSNGQHVAGTSRAQPSDVRSMQWRRPSRLPRVVEWNVATMPFGFATTRKAEWDIVRCAVNSGAACLKAGGPRRTSPLCRARRMRARARTLPSSLHSVRCKHYTLSRGTRREVVSS